MLDGALGLDGKQHIMFQLYDPINIPTIQGTILLYIQN